MATGDALHFYDPVTTVHATQKFPLGFKRLENGKEYSYVKAGAAILANEAVYPDTAATTGFQVLKTAAALGTPILGVAEQAFAINEFGWICTRGVTTALIKTGISAGDKLAASATAGSMNVAPTYGRQVHIVRPNNGGTLADGTTYVGLINPGVAGKVTGISVIAATAPIGGTNTLKVQKGVSGGNTMLSAASYDPTGLTNGQAAAMTLTSTAADLTIAATGANSSIYVEWVTGTQTTDAINCAVAVEFEPTQKDLPRAVALEANSSGGDAAKAVLLL